MFPLLFLIKRPIFEVQGPFPQHIERILTVSYNWSVSLGFIGTEMISLFVYISMK